jgi:hypothetical protein
MGSRTPGAAAASPVSVGLSNPYPFNFGLPPTFWHPPDRVADCRPCPATRYYWFPRHFTPSREPRDRSAECAPAQLTHPIMIISEAIRDNILRRYRVGPREQGNELRLNLNLNLNESPLGDRQTTRPSQSSTISPSTSVPFQECHFARFPSGRFSVAGVIVVRPWGDRRPHGPTHLENSATCHGDSRRRGRSAFDVA